MSVIIICLLIVGFLMTGWWSDKPFTGDLYFWHKSFGVVILLLALFRIPTRFYYRGKRPTLDGLVAWERWLSTAVHKLFYVFIVVMPVSGFLTSSFHPKSPGVSFFFGYIPNIFPKNEALAKFFADVHYISAYCILVLLFLHVAGVVKHRLFDKPENDSLRKML
jgi:cytochrome b561